MLQVSQFQTVMQAKYLQSFLMAFAVDSKIILDIINIISKAISPTPAKLIAKISFDFFFVFSLSA